MTREKLWLTGTREIFSIEVRPLTLLFKDGMLNGELQPLGRIVVDPQGTVWHAERCKSWHPSTRMWVERIKPGAWDAQDLCALHLKGLVDLSLKLDAQRVPFMLRYPETFLHPAQELQLADFLSALSAAAKTKEKER